MKTKSFPLLLATCLLASSLPAAAQTAWDGGGQTDGSWTNAYNWDNNTLPTFGGTDSLAVTRHAAYISSGGTLYTDPITVAITGDGSGATATATRNAAAINSITITNGGSGYSTVPSVAITGATGTDAVAVISLTATGSVAMAGATTMNLGADRSIGRISFGGSNTAYTLNGHTLRLNSTTTTAGAGTALWNANTVDGIQAVVNSNILLQSGTAGSYTGHFRENINSNGGTKFNGTITQGVDENWTLRFSRSSARGNFFLNNAANSIAAIRNEGADVFSDVLGAFGGAPLTLAGGITGTRLTDHYTTAVSNNITMSAPSTWASQFQTRLTGTMTQGAHALSYGITTSPGITTLTRLEYSSFSGTGTTSLIGGVLSTPSLGNFSSGTLNLGSSSGSPAVLVLSGTGGNGVPTWSEFSSAKTFNQSGGTNTWRIDAGVAGANSAPFGGFAARGMDLTIPASDGGLTSATFARNLMLGSSTMLDGNRYADHAVKIQTDIAYGSVAGANRYFMAAPNAGTSKTTNILTLAGPVHELSGQITGADVIMYPMGQTNAATGIVRISNAANSLTGTSRWMLGGQRGAFTSIGGGAIAGASNMGDNSVITLIFTSDGAFGGATEVQVSSQTSSGSAPSNNLLFEDTNGGGNTTFVRNINILNNNQTNGPAAWGSYGGDVVYTGTARHEGTTGNGDSIIHVQAGTMDLGVNGGSAATLTNNRVSATTHNKSGAGTLRIENLTVNGTQATNNWNVRQGSLLVNTTLAGAVTVSTGATLGGTGTIGGAVTTGSGGNAVVAPGASLGLLTLSGAFNAANGGVFKLELGSNATPGSTHDQIAASGVFTGSTAASGLKFEFTGLPGLAAGVPYTLLTFASASGLAYADLTATALPAGYILDPAFGTGGWMINSGSLQAQFLSTGVLSAYDDWADDYPSFSPTDPTLDFDKDGIKNLMEFVLGGNPTTNDNPSVHPTVTASGSDLLVTFKRSDASELQPVTVKVQVSDDLTFSTPANDILIGPGPTGTGPNSVTYTVAEGVGLNGLDTIQVTIPKGAATKKFARVLTVE